MYEANRPDESIQAAPVAAAAEAQNRRHAHRSEAAHQSGAELLLCLSDATEHR